MVIKQQNDSLNSSQDKPIIVKTTWPKAFSKVGATALIVVCIVTVVYLGIDSCNTAFKAPGEIVKEVGGAFEKIAKAFKTGKITEEFLSYAVSVEQNNRLQVCSFKAIERFSREESNSTAYGYFNYSAKVAITVPVEYTYYVDLNEEWKFIYDYKDVTKANYVSVVVPTIKYNTPAATVSEMKTTYPKESFFISEEDIRKKIMKDITPECELRAKKYADNNRANARESIKGFVDNWLTNIKFNNYDIKPFVKNVYFSDEVEGEKILNKTSLSLKE
jgi:hypothetical protein